MNREEAIKVIVENCYFNSFVPGAEEALAMAIKTLKQEPSDDCVSIQAMLKEIPRLWNSRSDKDYCMETLRDFVTELPSVTPTRKVGHWIDSEILGEFKCSCCGNYWQDAEENEYEDWVNIAKFCPVCGAKMEVEG